MAPVIKDGASNYSILGPLCGELLEPTTIAFFIGNPWHKLWCYSEAAMHWHCYVQWEHQPEVARLQFRTRVEAALDSSYWGIAYLDQRVMVSANPTWERGEIDVRLRLTGSGIRVSVDDWEQWVNDDWVRSSHHDLEHQALAEVIDALRTELPTGEVLIQKASDRLDFDPSSILGPRTLATIDICQHAVNWSPFRQDRYHSELLAAFRELYEACLNPKKVTASQCNMIFKLAAHVESSPYYARDAPRVVIWSLP